MKFDLERSFNEMDEVLKKFRTSPSFSQVLKAGELMAASIQKGGRIFSCGNGGSLCDAMHFAEELTGRFRDDRRALPAVAISDPSHITCVANDFGFDSIFSRYIEAHAKKGDVLLAISTSGKSANILKAAELAKKMDMTVVGLTGNTGGKLAPLCDAEVRVPHSGYSDRTQEVHIKVIHCWIEMIESLVVKS